MNKRQLFFGFIIGMAVFTYLVSSFLVATFDITMWKPEQRFFTVAIYLIFVWGVPKALADDIEQSNPPHKSVNKFEKQEAE